MTQKDITSEIDRELKMRRMDWPRIPQTDEKFVRLDHQRQYDAMQAAAVVFQTMYAAEFQLILNRAERLRREQEAQTKMEL